MIDSSSLKDQTALHSYVEWLVLTNNEGGCAPASCPTGTRLQFVRILFFLTNLGRKEDEARNKAFSEIGKEKEKEEVHKANGEATQGLKALGGGVNII